EGSTFWRNLSAARNNSAANMRSPLPPLVVAISFPTPLGRDQTQVFSWQYYWEFVAVGQVLGGDRGAAVDGSLSYEGPVAYTQVRTARSREGLSKATGWKRSQLCTTRLTGIEAIAVGTECAGQSNKHLVRHSPRAPEIARYGCATRLFQWANRRERRRASWEQVKCVRDSRILSKSLTTYAYRP